MEYCPIELKYKTRKIEASLNRFGEQVDNVVVVKNQGAQDIGMYDFWKDVKRVEMVMERFSNVKSGLAVFLTNDRAYKTLSRETSNNREFCMCEGWNSRSKHWQRETSITQSRKGFDLSKDYYLNWADTRLGEHTFYYCIAEI